MKQHFLFLFVLSSVSIMAMQKPSKPNDKKEAQKQTSTLSKEQPKKQRAKPKLTRNQRLSLSTVKAWKNS